MKTHHVREFGFVVGLALAFGSWAPSARLSQQPIRIGATTALTGEASTQGGYSREGQLLCQKHVNEKGGVLGRHIASVIYDHAANGAALSGPSSQVPLEGCLTRTLASPKLGINKPSCRRHLPA